ncbi:TPA: DUF2750 domain-containing protein [Bacillus cereus]|nr:DUF2750 domain-containing protein [Bacillus cereus]
MDMDLIINAQKRFTTFIHTVLETETIWGLKNTSGWCVCESNEYEDTDVMLFWSNKSYAQQCTIQEWANYSPTAIPLEQFLKNWLPGMIKDDLLVGVNWNTHLIGLELEPQLLLNFLNEKNL